MLCCLALGYCGRARPLDEIVNAIRGIYLSHDKSGSNSLLEDGSNVIEHGEEEARGRSLPFSVFLRSKSGAVGLCAD